MAAKVMTAPMGRGAWPPSSPYVWSDSWIDSQGNQKSLTLTFRYDNTTFVFAGLDYDLDPQCPWEFLIIVKSDGTRLTRQIPRGSRTGTVTAAQLATFGLAKFTDIGSITAGSTAS